MDAGVDPTTTWAPPVRWAGGLSPVWAGSPCHLLPTSTCRRRTRPRGNITTPKP